MNTLILCIFWIVVGSFAKNLEGVCLTSLPRLIKQELRKNQEWHWGISAIAKKHEEQIYRKIFDLDEEKWMNPASTNKLMTNAAILSKLGNNFKFETKIFKSDKNQICLRPQGDPTFTYDKLFHLLEGIKNDLNSTDTLYVDLDSFFGKNNLEVPFTWPLGYLWARDCAKPTAGVLNRNTETIKLIPGKKVGDPVTLKQTESPVEVLIDVSNVKTIEGSKDNINYRSKFGQARPLEVFGTLGINAKEFVDELAIPTPRSHFVDSCKFYLSKLGYPNIKVELIDDYHQLGNQWTERTKTVSDDLLKLANHTLQYSDNLYAELFLLQLGAQEGLKEDETAYDIGLNEIWKFLEDLGVNKKLFQTSDGSGISKENFISAKSLTELLVRMKVKDSGLETILPVAGLSGSLINRFLDYKGILTAKTGTLASVTSLAGYILHPYYYEDVIFSIIQNNGGMSPVESRKTIDKIAILLASVDPRC